MVTTLRYKVLLLVTLVFVCEAMTGEYIANPDIGTYTEEELAAIAPYIANQEVCRYTNQNAAFT